MSEWLNSLMDQDICAFHLPYKEDLGGVGREPWHISFTAESKELEESMSVESLSEIINSADILLKDAILENIDFIFNTYVKRTFKPWVS